MKKHKPKSINKAIDELEEFLQADLPSHLFDTEIEGKIFVRTDKIKNEEELSEYLDGHFNLLRKQIKEQKEMKG